MEFNVAQLLRQPTGTIKHYQVNQPSEIGDPALRLEGPTHGTVDLLRTQRGILVTAHLHQTARVECVRCLSDVRTSLEVHIEEEFVPSIDLKTGAHLDWGPEDDVEDSQIINERHILDLHEVVRQELILALPAHPLCKTDCAGLCPICGADRNTESCGCDVTDLDPRWSALSRLKEEIQARELAS